MNAIEQRQRQLHRYRIDFLSESDCDRILAEYATQCQTVVACPYKPQELLLLERGRVGQTNLHVVGMGAVSYGHTPFEAKLGAIIHFLDRGYFKLDDDLNVTRLL